jgi:hypothetical protein
VRAPLLVAHPQEDVAGRIAGLCSAGALLEAYQIGAGLFELLRKRGAGGGGPGFRGDGLCQPARVVHVQSHFFEAMLCGQPVVPGLLDLPHAECVAGFPWNVHSMQAARVGFEPGGLGPGVCRSFANQVHPDLRAKTVEGVQKWHERLDIDAAFAVDPPLIAVDEVVLIAEARTLARARLAYACGHAGMAAEQLGARREVLPGEWHEAFHTVMGAPSGDPPLLWRGALRVAQQRGGACEEGEACCCVQHSTEGRGDFTREANRVGEELKQEERRTQ